MANSFRGEVRIEIAGKGYDVAMTLDALGRIATALGAETLEQVEERLQAFRIADFRPVLEGLLTGNGHDVPADDLGSVHYATFLAFLREVYTKRPGAPQTDAKPEGKASPPKRAA